MGVVYINFTVQVDDGEDKAAAENAYADLIAQGIGSDPMVTSASFSSDTTGLINLHDRHATLAAQQPAEHPVETGPAAEGVGVGPEGTRATFVSERSTSQPPQAQQ
jgi:hypothetical protein